MPLARTNAFGWAPDVPDHRDYHWDHEAVVRRLRRLKIRASKSELPARVDWRDYCGPIEDQQDLPTGCAHACLAMVQQFERRASGQLLQPSRLFSHQAAQRLSLGMAGQFSLRTMLKAILRCGLPPEKYWPYQSSHLQKDPDPFLYSFQRDYRAMNYVRLDRAPLSGREILPRLLAILAAGFSFVCGFPICSSLGQDAEIPFPTQADTLLGSHAVTVVGYDSKLRIRSDRGALLVRNSWGVEWGDAGYGWLPFSYVLNRLAMDYWTLIHPAWLKSSEFEMPSF